MNALANNERHVRQMECAGEILRDLEEIRSYRRRSYYIGYEAPSALYLIQHFLVRCPHIVKNLGMTTKFFSYATLFRACIEILPRVTSLAVENE